MPFDKEVGTVTSRVSTTTNTPTATKTATAVPMDVSQISSNVSKTEAEEVTHTNTSKTRNAMETKCLLSRERAKVVSRERVFKCGMRGHKADRYWQKGKGQGKGSKGDWEKGKSGSKGKRSNPGHTWDSSWYNSHLHEKTYGLEVVDPWSAVEPVPQLCVVSLSATCEEFSEPKRMTKETHTKTSQSGSEEFRSREQILNSCA